MAFLVSCFAGSLQAAQFKQLDGTVLDGEIIYMGPDGVSIKLDDGKYTKRLKWETFTQETLQQFSKNPKATKFVELLVATAENIDEDKMEIRPKAPKPPVNLDVKRSPGRPAVRVGLKDALTSGMGWLVLVLIYGANLYSAFSVAFFRRRPWWMVCGLAAVAPVATQAVFLALPAARPVAAPEQAAEGGAQAGHEAQAMPVAQAMPIDPALTGAQPAFGAPGAHAAYAQAPAETAPAPVALPPTQVYRRGEFNLNRRFIEAKFSGFFRVIPSEADRDLLLVVKSARGEFISRHITRATNTEVVFQVLHESGATTDEAVPLNDLFEIQVRHKDAPPQ